MRKHVIDLKINRSETRNCINLNICSRQETYFHGNHKYINVSHRNIQQCHILPTTPFPKKIIVTLKLEISIKRQRMKRSLKLINLLKNFLNTTYLCCSMLRHLSHFHILHRPSSEMSISSSADHIEVGLI